MKYVGDRLATLGGALLLQQLPGQAVCMPITLVRMATVQRC